MDAALGAWTGVRFAAGRELRELFAGREVFRDAERIADPDRAALARFWAGLRAEVRGFETRRVFAI